MPDDKTKVGEPDRSRVAADQDYEVRRLAEKHGISLERARDLIATHVKLQPSFRLLLLAFRGCYQSRPYAYYGYRPYAYYGGGYRPYWRGHWRRHWRRWH
jgi:Protein of unknown function (DUF3606)